MALSYRDIQRLQSTKTATPEKLYTGYDINGVLRNYIGTGDKGLRILNTNPVQPVTPPITPSGTPLAGVQSVTGLNTDNTDPLNPVVQISVDGVSITGLGTPGSPLIAAAGAPYITASTDTSTIDITVAAGSLSAIVVAGSIGPTQLANTAVTLGTYGDATNVPQFTVDADGRITNAVDVPITFPTGFITSILDTSTVDLDVTANVLSANVLLTATEIGFGDGSGNLTSSSNLTWVNATQNFVANGTMNINLLNSANAFYVAQGDAGFWFTGAASTGLLGHRGFGLDLKTTEIYTMGDALSGSGNGNYLEIDDTNSTALLSTLAGVGTRMVTADATGTLGTTAIPATITPAALTRVDDTNVTLTLGGTPATALLQASSLTLGWTRTLAIARGGTAGATAADARTNLGTMNTLQYFSATINPASATTYYIGAFPDNAPITTANRMYIEVPYDCVLIGASCSLRVSSTVDTAANNIAVSAFITNTTTLALFNITAQAVIQTATVTGLSTSLTGGTDTIEIKVLTPTFTTLPQGVRFTVVLYFK